MSGDTDGPLNNFTVVLVDDDDAVRDSLSGYLESDGWTIREAASAEEALELVQSGTGNIVISDVRMPGMDGITLIGKLLEHDPDIEVLITTGHSTEEMAINALKAGAFDYFRKPLNGREISASLQRTRRVSELKMENKRLKALLARLTRLNKRHAFVGRSAASQGLLNKFEKVAASPGTTVLLTGESGVGKEVAARMIHQLSHADSSAPFIALNCGGVAESLLESELFGHEKGAFTGADKRVPGIFEMADGGTVFLDEISELSNQAQSRLLRVLEERAVRRLGGTREVSVANTRVVAATNRDLKQCVDDNAFREDLYYRIMVAAIRIPALRDRPEDIIPLATFFLSELSKRNGKNYSLSPDAETHLQAYDFPGNIRDLRNTLERATVFADHEVIQASDLGLDGLADIAETNTGVGGTMAMPSNFNLAANEEALIRSVLATHPDNHSAAARALGISPQALYRKIEKYKLSQAR